MTLGLIVLAISIFFHAILGAMNMALDRTALDAGLQAVADGLAALAESIANPPTPPTDLAEAQAALDDTGARLSAFAAQLVDMKSAEDAEDAA